MPAMGKISRKRVLPRLDPSNSIPKIRYIELRNTLKLCGVFSCDKDFVKR